MMKWIKNLIPGKKKPGCEGGVIKALSHEEAIDAARRVYDEKTSGLYDKVTRNMLHSMTGSSGISMAHIGTITTTGTGGGGTYISQQGPFPNLPPPLQVPTNQERTLREFDISIDRVANGFNISVSYSRGDRIQYVATEENLIEIITQAVLHAKLTGEKK